MEQPPQEAWYYTKAGERLGPVSHDELQQIILNGELHPSSDLIWKAGMETWKAVREMRDVFQFPQAATKPAETPSAATKPATATKPVASTKPVAVTTHSASSTIESPRAESAPKDVEDLEWPGARRRVYILVTLLLPLLLAAATPFAQVALGSAIGIDNASMILGGGFLILLILSVVVTLMRLSNLAMSRWWILGFWVPLLNLWLWYRCIACPAGYASHKQLGKMGVLLAFLYWGFWTLPVIAAVCGAMLFQDIAADQEKMAKIKQVLRQVLEPMLQTTPQTPAPQPDAPPAEP